MNDLPTIDVALHLAPPLVFFVTWLVQPQCRDVVVFPWWKRLALPAALVLGGLGGSKLPVVLASSDWVADCRSLTTALAVGYLMVEAARVACMMPPAARDSLALPLALGLVAARLECFAEGCCRGAETSLFVAVDFGDGVPRHPTQLYEVCFHLASAATILAWSRSQSLRGDVLRIYLIAYCLFRFVTEWIRLEPASCLGFTFSQVIVAMMGTVLAILWWRDVAGMQAAVVRRSPQGMAEE